MKKIICTVLSILLLGIGSLTPLAATVSSEGDLSDIDIPLEASTTVAAIGQTLDIKAKSAILMEPHTGQILYESNPDEQLAPASITKIMSLLLVMEAIDRKTMSLKDKISASEHACSMGGSQIWLEPAETMTVDELLKAAVIASANDATVALGEAIAGSEEGFVAMMNERAKELGMNNTNFINCTGLDAEGHFTTAHDVAVMSCELIKHDLIKNYSTVWMDTLRNGESELVNTNKLVRFYNGTTGLKTGTTSTAGYCLSATAERNGLELVAVIMGGDSSTDRFEGAKKLLDYGFANYSFVNIEPEYDKNQSIGVEKGAKAKVSTKVGAPIGLLLKKTEAADIEQETIIKKNIKAPVKKGDVLGQVNIYINGSQVGAIDITATENVEQKSLATMLWWLISGLFMP